MGEKSHADPRGDHHWENGEEGRRGEGPATNTHTCTLPPPSPLSTWTTLPPEGRHGHHGISHCPLPDMTTHQYHLSSLLAL